MYKYTADKSVLHKYASIRKNSKRPWDDEFYFACTICGGYTAYSAVGKFWKNYSGITYFSTTKRKQVPVNGVLIDVCWFKEEIV